MKNIAKLLLLGGCLSLTFPAGYAAGQQEKTKTLDTSRDARENGPTADNQKNNQADRRMTADIRKAVVDDKDLSTSAHNVKIITRNGEVTLRGRVKSEEEKRAVVAKAEEIAGKGKVTDSLMIAPDHSKETRPDK
jgi:osmotically-inducible protein OsmY